MDYENVHGYLVRMSQEVEKLESVKLLQCDEIRALKAETRSYKDELARVTISHEEELGRIRVSYREELARVTVSHEKELGRIRSSYEEELARMRKEIGNLGAVKEHQQDSIRARNVEARSYQDEIDRLQVERTAHREKIDALKIKAISRREELVQLRNEIDNLEGERLVQHEKIGKLEAERLFQQETIEKLEAERLSQQEEIRELKVETMEETPARNIGREVRLRYLENHRKYRMGRHIGILGHDRIKRGDRAAHRGRPMVDALLCLSADITDREVYPDLYGVGPEIIKQWKDVPGIIEVTGFRASLVSEKKLTNEFQTHFQNLLNIATTYLSPTELTAAFGENKSLVRRKVTTKMGWAVMSRIPFSTLSARITCSGPTLKPSIVYSRMTFRAAFS
ncbi:unnamed protein product [Calypogeia fissa]